MKTRKFVALACVSAAALLVTGPVSASERFFFRTTSGAAASVQPTPPVDDGGGTETPPGDSGGETPPPPPPENIDVTATAPGGTILTGQPFSYQFSATGAVGSVSWSITAPPSGMAIDGSGTLHWTATSPGSFPVTVTATDSNGTMGELLVSITVQAAPFAATSASFSSGSIAATMGGSTTIPVSLSGYWIGTPSFGLVDVGGTLSASGSGAEWVLTWTPAAEGFDFGSILIGDQSNPQRQVTLGPAAFDVSPEAPAGEITFMPPLMQPGVVDTFYSVDLKSYTSVSIEGATTDDLLWTLQSPGTLPPGLELDPFTGVISGFPSLVGSYSSTVIVSYAGISTSGGLLISIQ